MCHDTLDTLLSFYYDESTAMRLAAPLSIVILLLLISQPVEAQFRSTNNETTIEINTVDIAPTNTPKPTPRTSAPTATPTNIPPKQGTVPLPPLPPEKPEEPKFFTLTLSHSDIDFGMIDPTEPSIRTNTLSLMRGNAQGMSLFAYQNHPLETANKAFIPDTTCDDGTCTPLAGSIWANTLTYGSGYHCETDTDKSPACASDFMNQQTYRPFATVSESHTAGSLLAPNLKTDTLHLKLNYKINVSGTQQKGSYTNALMFIAAPTF